MGKHTKKTERVTTIWRDLTPDDWSKIFSIPFMSSLRGVIGLLFIQNGKGNAGTITQGTWSRAMHINRLMIEHNLPYRLRKSRLPDGDCNAIESGFDIYSFELQIQVVT